MKKCLLKKCRSCHFKKRLCLLDRSNCAAFEKTCFACNKTGHYPKSLNCKKTRKIHKGNRTKSKNKVQHPSEIHQISPTVFKLINAKIKQLEDEIQEPLICSSEDDPSHIELVPFIMMYIFLNYEFVFSLKTKIIKTNLLDQARKEANVKKSILKLAKSCAGKFENGKDTKEKHYFAKFCSKRLQKMLNLKSMPSSNTMIENEKTLDAFNKMYYNDQEFCESDQSDCYTSQSVLNENNDLFPSSGDHNVDEFAMYNQDSRRNIKTDDEKLPIKLDEDENADGSRKKLCVVQNMITQLYSKGQQSSPDENLITQLDGHADGSSEEEVIIKKKLFSVHFENKEVAQVVTFFRGFNFVWESLASHKMCAPNSSSENCFFLPYEKFMS